ncbi:hypothetical protein [Microbacterium jejuense]|uniref:hypothetical protein n=1 Tax=Microbacterium jejuense TaxID=1263637 RepID=UPI0031ED22A8
MPDAIDAIAEIFSWIGFGLGILLAVVALIMRLADGTWVRTQGVVDDGPHGRLVRWFDDHAGGVGSAYLTHEQEHRIGASQTAEIYVRPGRPDRMRLTAGSPAVRAVTLLAAGLLALGVIALATSLILLFVRG